MSEQARDAACELEKPGEVISDPRSEMLVCRCEEISAAEIRAALEGGATDMNDLKRETRAGMGLCQGRTCKRLLARMIADHTGRDISEVTPASFQPPVRPLKLAFGGPEK